MSKASPARDKARAERNREFRALEQAPPPVAGRPGEFRQDARRQRQILEWARAFRDATIRARSRRGSTGPS